MSSRSLRPSSTLSSSSSSSSCRSRSSNSNSLMIFMSMFMFMMMQMNMLLRLPLVSATITIYGTGDRFPSRPDRMIGSVWIPGSEYLHRLQTMTTHPDLCPTTDNDDDNDNHNNNNNNHEKDMTTQNFTVYPPLDGYPVALLVRGDEHACSDMTRVNIAKYDIQPHGIVKSLIIYYTEFVSDADLEQWNQQQQQEMDHHEQHHAITDLERHAGGKNHHSKDHHADATRMGVLHVSLSTGTELLKLIQQQSQQDAYYGGPRVLLDGNTGRSTDAADRFLRSFVFWVGLGLMLTGCLVSFCLSMQYFDDRPNTTINAANAPTRPERRRLTRQQVEEWIPEFYFGQHDANNNSNNDDDDDDKQDPLKDDHHDHHHHHTDDALSCASMQECSICLDGFETGDAMRKLPCRHEFHADCIGKWLVERHSTCPLCKLDLLPNEEQEQEDEESSIVDNSDIPLVVSQEESPREASSSSPSSYFSWPGWMSRTWNRHDIISTTTPTITMTTTTTPTVQITTINPTAPNTTTTIALHGDDDTGVDPTPLLQHHHHEDDSNV